MHPRGFLTRFGSALLLTLIAATASAQSRFYVGGTAIADIRRFDSLELDPRILASLADISSRDGTAPGGGVRVGTFLHPRWSLELAVDAGGKTTSSFQNPIDILPIRSSTLRLPELSTSSSFLTVSTVVGFHPEKIGPRPPWLPRRNGVGQRHVRIDISDVLVHSDRAPVHDEAVSSIPGLVSVTQAVSTTTGGTLRRTDNSVGGVFGLEAAIDLSDHFALVPGVRAVVFSSGGQSIFLIRPEAGVRWLILIPNP